MQHHLQQHQLAAAAAAAGQMAQVDLRVLWLSPRNNVRVTVDGGEETVLQGTVLPPAEEGGGRRFRSRVGGRIQVLLVTDVPSSRSFVSLALSASYNCTEEPASMNSGNPKGCPGATYMGHPYHASEQYCSGYHRFDNGTSGQELIYPWWAACCRWTRNTCVPVCADLDARATTVDNECCDEACVCRRNVTSEPCVLGAMRSGVPDGAERMH